MIKITKLILVLATSALITPSCNNPRNGNNASDSDQYIVYKSTTGNVCKVQRPTERPLFGAKHLGPFTTKEKAVQAMCKDIDPTMSDPDKCWESNPADACATTTLNSGNDSSKLNLNYFTPVRLLKQPKSMDCWATALTILHSWKTGNNTITIESLLNTFGDPYPKLFKNNSGITPKDEEKLYTKAKLKIVKGLNPSIAGWYNLLSKHGPLSITVDAEPPNGTIHALIINGIKGDGSPNNTKIDYVDPADGVQRSLEFAKFIKLYEGSSNWPLQIIHWP